MTHAEKYRPAYKPKPFQGVPLDKMGLCEAERKLASNVSTAEFLKRYKQTRSNAD